MWNKRKKVILSALLTSLFLFACGDSAAEEPVSLKPDQTAVIQTDSFVLPDHYIASPPAKKEETVSVETDAYGKPKKITVEAVLSGIPGEGYIRDVSTLSDIRNLEGNEEFAETDGSVLIWENRGQTIQYKGSSLSSLPVGVKITYFLDGKEISAEDLAGKSGHVKLRFDYENHTEVNQTADGISYTLPVPFLAATLVPLSDKFTNVTAENGRVLRLSDSDAVVGFAAAGLSESLKLSGYELTKDVKIPEYLEIEADVTEFELDFTETIFTSGLFSELDESDLDDANELKEDMDQLQDASGKLRDGTGKLYDGMKEFEDYLLQYNDGIAKVSDGIRALKEGIGIIDDYSSDLNKGAKALSLGLTQLNEGVKTLDFSQMMDEETAQALFGLIQILSTDVQTMQETVDSLKENYETAENYYDVINTYYCSLKKTDKEIKDLQALPHSILSEEDKAEILSRFEDNPELLEQVLTMVEYYSLAPSLADTILQETAVLSEPPSDPSEELSALNNSIALTEAHLSVLIGALEEIQKAAGSIAGLPEMIEQFKTAIAQLALGSQQFQSGLSAYTDGISELYEGAALLSEGSDQIPEASGALSEGYAEILSGVWELKDGVRKFDEEGIRELTKLGGTQLQDLLRRVKALRKIDLEYVNYSGIPEGTEGSVRFLFETEEIKP